MVLHQPIECTRLFGQISSHKLTCRYQSALDERIGDLSSGQNHFGDMRACGTNPLLSLTTSAVTDPPWFGTDKKQKAWVANFGAGEPCGTLIEHAIT
jgi:hypothetical protein